MMSRCDSVLYLLDSLSETDARIFRDILTKMSHREEMESREALREKQADLQQFEKASQ